MTPKQRTDRYYQAIGYDVDNVERYNHHCKRKFDLFGIIDRIAISEHDIIGLQVCKADFQAHDMKILNSEYGPKWCRGGRRLILIGWTLQKVKRGGKAMVYKPRIKEYTQKDFK